MFTVTTHFYENQVNINCFTKSNALTSYTTNHNVLLLTSKQCVWY